MTRPCSRGALDPRTIADLEAIIDPAGRRVLVAAFIDEFAAGASTLSNRHDAVSQATLHCMAGSAGAIGALRLSAVVVRLQAATTDTAFRNGSSDLVAEFTAVRCSLRSWVLDSDGSNRAVA